MKRSEINSIIEEALSFFDKMQFRLPPWSTWGLNEWKENFGYCHEIFNNQLGWDLTDFGSGKFSQTGLLLFTIRNGNPVLDKKPYAEKIMIVDEAQVTPMHFHWSKMEDIINRGGGNLCIELCSSDEQEGLSNKPFRVSIDGMDRELNSGDTVTLKPGESITLYQGLYHKFYGEPGSGRVMVGEVSAVNDDHTDNRFLDAPGRFPEIEEDTAPRYLLVSDYQKYLKPD